MVNDKIKYPSPDKSSTFAFFFLFNLSEELAILGLNIMSKSGLTEDIWTLQDLLFVGIMIFLKMVSVIIIKIVSLTFSIVTGT